MSDASFMGGLERSNYFLYKQKLKSRIKTHPLWQREALHEVLEELVQEELESKLKEIRSMMNR